MISIKQTGFSHIRRHPARRLWGAAPAALLCLPLIIGPVTNTSAEDLPTVKFSGNGIVDATEGSTVTLTVVKEGQGAAEVGYETRHHANYSDRATPGEDYTAVSGTLSFADGDTQKTFEVKTLTDSDDTEGQEIIDVYLEDNPDGAVRGVPGVTVILLN